MIQRNRLLYFEWLLAQVVYTWWSTLGQIALRRREIVGTKFEHEQSPENVNAYYSFTLFAFKVWINKMEINVYCHSVLRTFRFSTPHREKSVIFSVNAIFSGSFDSGRIEHARSVSGWTPLSSANNGEPLNPNGFLSRAVIISAVLELVVANEHWISLTWIYKKKTIFVRKKKPIHLKIFWFIDLHLLQRWIVFLPIFSIKLRIKIQSSDEMYWEDDSKIAESRIWTTPVQSNR